MLLLGNGYRIRRMSDLSRDHFRMSIVFSARDYSYPLSTLRGYKCFTTFSCPRIFRPRVPADAVHQSCARPMERRFRRYRNQLRRRRRRCANDGEPSPSLPITNPHLIS
jgi:hypothetical protein